MLRAAGFAFSGRGPCLCGFAKSMTVIATQLYLSVGTVKSHMANIYRKFGIHSHQELLDIVDSVQAEFSKNTKDN